MAKKKWTIARAFPLMLMGAVGVGVIVLAVGNHLRRATIIEQSTANLPAGAMEGEPCAVMTKAEYEARGAKAAHAFITNDIRYERRYGHADCSIVKAGGAGNDFVPVCQFSGPAQVVVTTDKGAFYFAPGVGRPATVATRDGVPTCVIPKVPPKF
ncbi:hypothetical protein GGQ61_003428 [Phenylobacterium haematophilum]|uniref:Uncharacterized protein n=1 Tax=Phenylobacterium haematophilum TaxID=98513 RepID=A0A840A5R1_9CAUL|nr:hypothetical protein [Phenylobacterium haematophilum]MBB3892692.1 hypothetical protein [Phenylobacterium haematophilum]